ncbi:MAG: hypothetical protein K1X67_01510 [Fimbriimonadaceae bacterium]|nr:hypothetical protein [Fimbriimonadaceae bacterium]
MVVDNQADGVTSLQVTINGCFLSLYYFDKPFDRLFKGHALLQYPSDWSLRGAVRIVELHTHDGNRLDVISMERTSAAHQAPEVVRDIVQTCIRLSEEVLGYFYPQAVLPQGENKVGLVTLPCHPTYATKDLSKDRPFSLALIH